MQTHGLPRPELVAIVARANLVGCRRSTDECTRSARRIGRDSVTMSTYNSMLRKGKSESSLVMSLSKIP